MAKITIFGLAGTGTSSVGKKLAEQLGYEYLSSGSIFRRKAAELGLDLYQFEALCNTDASYDKALDQEIEQYGKTHQNFIVESRLAWYFIPDSFKIKLTCDLNERVRRVASRDGITAEDALQKTIFREESGVKRYAATYGISDFAPDNLFNLTLDTTAKPIAELVEIIGSTLIEKGLIESPIKTA